MKKYIFASLTLFFIVGCANKELKIENQTALKWHKIIFDNIKNRNLDNADDAFTSLEVEHPESNFIPIDLLNLSIAHAKNYEFELAIFYMNQYKKRYASFENKEWAEYMIAKYKFYSIQNAYTNQAAINEAIKYINSIINLYPNSIYNYELNTMKLKLELTKKLFREKIANLYKKLDKPKSAKLYEEKIDLNNIIPPEIPWYKKLFLW